MKISNKVGRYILIGIGASIIIAFLYGQFITAPKFRERGRYTIGIFYKYRYKKGGAYDIFYTYKVKNILFKGRYNYSSTNFDKSDLGRKFLVEYVDGEEDLSSILMDCIVPDSIKEAPPEGWKKMPEWASDKIRWFNTK